MDPESADAAASFLPKAKELMKLIPKLRAEVRKGGERANDLFARLTNSYLELGNDVKKAMPTFEAFIDAKEQKTSVGQPDLPPAKKTR